MFANKSNVAKRAVGVAAANLVEDRMVVGIGSGSTARCFIQALIDRKFAIEAVATSNASYKMAKEGGIKMRDLDEVKRIDLAIDGADEIDPERRMIKGGGGALLREKIIAANADEMVVIVDETKLVDKLGTFGLPVEILPFGKMHTIRKLEELGYGVSLREGFATDNGNFLVDLSVPLLDDPAAHDTKIRAIPGVIETGLFLGLAGRVLIGFSDGSVEIRV